MIVTRHRSTLLFSAISLGLALAGCGQEPASPADTELETANTDGEAEALALKVEATDFGSLQLGGRISGPQGEEFRARLATAEGNFADIRSYVACPKGMDPCDPKTAPAGTVYTYVHTVFPGEDNDSTTGAGKGNDASDVEVAEAFKMLQPAWGFNGVAGYSEASVEAALNKQAEVGITCHGGSLVWTVATADKGDTWEQAEPITFFWQSTLPPAGPADVYAIVANYAEAKGPGPFPAKKAGEAAGCKAPSTAG